MIKSFVKNSPLKIVETAEHFGIEASSLSKILTGGTYAPKEFYDELYALLERHNGIAPKRNGVVLYPCGISKGSFEVWINDRFAVAMVFYNEYDMLNFLNEEDGRLSLIKNLLVCEEDIQFKNRIHSKGKKWVNKVTYPLNV